MKKSTPAFLVEFVSIEDIKKKLITANIQPTAQRIAICKYTFTKGLHTTAESIKKWADDHFPTICLATVYNTLNALVKAGLLKELKFSDSEKSIYDNNLAEHYHFFDEKSGEIMDLYSPQIKLSHKLPKQFQIRRVDILLTGEKI